MVAPSAGDVVLVPRFPSRTHRRLNRRLRPAWPTMAVVEGVPPIGKTPSPNMIIVDHGQPPTALAVDSVLELTIAM